MHVVDRVMNLYQLDPMIPDSFAFDFYGKQEKKIRKFTAEVIDNSPFRQTFELGIFISTAGKSMER